jgi:hypothetical protein
MSFTYDVEVTPAEIRRAWGAMIDGANPFRRQKAPRFIADGFRLYRSSEADPWIGATGAEINERLIHGYTPEASDHQIGHAITEHTMAVMELDEEQGDLLIDQVLGGEELYRVQWSEQPAPRAITIRACIGMAASTDSSILNAYLTWLLRVADAAHRRGVQASIELWIGTNNSFAGRPGETMRVRIPLVDAGEMVDVASWQAYLTPGAFRSLGFFAMALAADRLNRSLTTGMGQPTNTRWNVSFEDGVLDIECPASADDFPEAEMDRLLAESGV